MYSQDPEWVSGDPSGGKLSSAQHCQVRLWPRLLASGGGHLPVRGNRVLGAQCSAQGQIHSRHYLDITPCFYSQCIDENLISSWGEGQGGAASLWAVLVGVVTATALVSTVSAVCGVVVCRTRQQRRWASDNRNRMEMDRMSGYQLHTITHYYYIILHTLNPAFCTEPMPLALRKAGA